jgi:hypothetical protein
MSRRGNCWDNAVCESFFATLKVELVYRNRWNDRATARAAIAEYIECSYNPQRRHSSLGYLSPTDYEKNHDRTAAQLRCSLCRGNATCATRRLRRTGTQRCTMTTAS